MALAKVASNSAFKQSKDLTGGLDKKIFKAGYKFKGGMRRLAVEVLWFFGAAMIAFLAGFLVFYLIGEFLTSTFVEYVKQLDSMTKFYFWIFLFCFIGVYIARLLVWAIKMVLKGGKTGNC